MKRFMLRRIAQAVLSLLAVSLFVFLLVRTTGDPVELLAPFGATQQDIAELREYYGLDDSLTQQYLRFVSRSARGDFGRSITFRRPVSDLMAERAGRTIQLVLGAMACAITGGIGLGVVAARSRGSRRDRIVRGIVALGQATPPFYLGTVLILVFAVILRWLPASGGQGTRGLILPVVTLGLYALTGLARLVRSAMIETLNTDYVLFGRARGLSEVRITWLHAGKNAALVILTFVALLIAQMIGGAVIIEVVFSTPGLGTQLISGVMQRDYPMVQGIVLVLAALYIGVNLGVDILYGKLNPKLRNV